MSVRLGIMGFGKLGRNMFRIGHDQPDITFAAASDLADVETLAYLLKSSTVEGPFRSSMHTEGQYIVTEDQRMRMIQGTKPGHVPWDVLGADIVIEATGVFRTREELQKHLDAGAKAVILSTPPVGTLDKLIINGINDDELTADDRIISNGSSSCHALALVLKLLNEKVGVKRATMTTVHAYTSDQQLSDTASGSLRWSRSAAQNIIPTTTGAAKAVTKVIPALAGKLDGLAMRVPVPDGSVVDFTAILSRDVTKDEMDAAFRSWSEGPLKGILEFCDEPIVGADIVGNTSSSVYDSLASMAMGNLVKVVSWYDNEWAYSVRVADLTEKVGEVNDLG